VGRRVGIPAYGHTARQRKALFRSDDMDDALSFIGERKVLETKIFNIRFELQHLRPRRCFFNKFGHTNELGPVRRGDIVVDRDEGAVGSTHTAFGQAQPVKGLR
jgi:hypothetical protein